LSSATSTRARAGASVEGAAAAAAAGDESGIRSRQQRLDEPGLGHRLGEVGGDPTRAGRAGGGRGQQHDANRVEGGLGGQGPRQLEPVHAGHVEVHEGDVGERAAGRGPPEQRQCRLGIGSDRHGHAVAHQLALQDQAVGGVVVDDQRRLPVERAERRLRPGRQVGPGRQPGREPERAPLAGGAADPDGAAHHLDKSLGDGQPQARASVVPGGRGVGLHEGLEQPLLVLFGDAHPGVADLDPHQVGPGRVHRHGHRHLAPLGELDGVAGQVGEHLAEAAGVAGDHPRDGRVDGDHQLQALLLGQRRQQPDRALHQGPQLEVRDLEFEAAGLDLGEVEHVVDQLQERLARALGHEGELALVGIQVGAQQETGHPDHPIQGRADLMAHVGHELGLQPGGLHRLPLGHFERRQRGLQLGRPVVDQGEGEVPAAGEGVDHDEDGQGQQQADHRDQLRRAGHQGADQRFLGGDDEEPLPVAHGDRLVEGIGRRHLADRHAGEGQLGGVRLPRGVEPHVEVGEQPGGRGQAGPVRLHDRLAVDDGALRRGGRAQGHAHGHEQRPPHHGRGGHGRAVEGPLHGRGARPGDHLAGVHERARRELDDEAAGPGPEDRGAEQARIGLSREGGDALRGPVAHGGDRPDKLEAALDGGHPALDDEADLGGPLPEQAPLLVVHQALHEPGQDEVGGNQEGEQGEGEHPQAPAVGTGGHLRGGGARPVGRSSQHDSSGPLRAAS
jgi:hypothetical protein